MNKSEYKPLTLPKISWDKKTLTETFGKVVAQPLEPGFGITLGNALRRTLLGGIEGSAVTSVIIKGVNNEFATIPGVIEDIMQLLLNIKQIVIKNAENKPCPPLVHDEIPKAASKYRGRQRRGVTSNGHSGAAGLESKVRL